MFSEMRRKKQKMTDDATINLLKECQYCMLATMGEEQWPYSTPISYIYLDDKIYVHGLKKGMKFDNIDRNPKVCLTVVRDTVPFWDDGFTTTYESANVFGIAKRMEDDGQIVAVLKALVDKYLPDHMEKADANIDKMWKAVTVVEIEIEHMTGKENKKPL